MDRYSLTAAKRANGAYVKASDAALYEAVAIACRDNYASHLFHQGEDYEAFMKRQADAYNKLMVALQVVGYLPEGQPLYLPGYEPKNVISTPIKPIGDIKPSTDRN